MACTPKVGVTMDAALGWWITHALSTWRCWTGWVPGATCFNVHVCMCVPYGSKKPNSAHKITADPEPIRRNRVGTQHRVTSAASAHPPNAEHPAQPDPVACPPARQISHHPLAGAQPAAVELPQHPHFPLTPPPPLPLHDDQHHHPIPPHVVQVSSTRNGRRPQAWLTSCAN